MKKTVLLFLAAAMLLPLSAKPAKTAKPAWPDDNKVRISWDAGNFTRITNAYVANKGFVETDFYYPRIKRLSDGALLMSFMNHHYGWNAYAMRSEDDGRSWGPAFCIAHHYAVKYKDSKGAVKDDEIVYVNPDFIELQDGRIIMAFQWRYKGGYGDLPKTNENCGIMISFSSDKGRTWDEPREVYRGRCWEPAFLQLPSGEIQMYITSSQDIKDRTSNPRTIVIRSFDGGKTWQGKECCGIHDNEAISRTYDERFCYDGMPSGVLLDDGAGIAVPLESWHGRLVLDVSPIIVKTTMEENWRGDQQKIVDQGGPDYPMKKQINKDLKAYGPYGSKLGSGEVVVLCNGTYKGVQGVWTLVGDKKADNFHNATSPFTGGEYWGCIDYIGGNRVIASAAEKVETAEGVKAHTHAIQGRLNYAKEIGAGSLEMPSVKDFDIENNDWWFLGREYPSRVFANFGYTKDALEFGAYVFDSSISAFTPENSDAPVFLFARPGGKTYKLAVNARGHYTLYEEEGWSWHKIAEDDTLDLEVDGSVNNDRDKDLGYLVKVCLPWKLIGGAPAKGEEIKVHLRRIYKGKSAEKFPLKQEDLQGENSDYPAEWLGITLK